MHRHELRVSHGDLRAVCIGVFERNYILISPLLQANILFDNGKAYICDFGLSRADDGTKGLSTSQKGNAKWMAPERLNGESRESGRPTPQSDIFEYGVTFYEVNNLNCFFRIAHAYCTFAADYYR